MTPAQIALELSYATVCAGCRSDDLAYDKDAAS